MTDAVLPITEKSAAPTPVTSSLNVTIQVSVSALVVASDGVPRSIDATTGAAPSVSSLTIVPVPVASPIAALDGLDRVRITVSSGSRVVSFSTVTVTVRLVWPGVKVTVPLAAV